MDARGTVAQLGKRDADDEWMDAQLGGGMLLWEERMLNQVEGCFCGREGHWIRILMM